mgnify:CR=1 FL=1
MSCAVCDYLRLARSELPGLSARRSLGALLDLHVRNRHPELLQELQELVPIRAAELQP